MTDNKELISKEKLQEAAVYFGHKKDKWNPKMRPYIATIKKGTHILDLDKTKRTLEFAYTLIRNLAKKGAKFVFVGTKKQAKATIKENALRTNSYHVSERWLGGTLTNSRTIFQRVRRMETLEKLEASEYEGYTKKEGLLLAKELAKLQRNLNGIRTMRYKPNVMIVADMASDAIAIKEARRLGVKVIALADSNDDPSFVDIAIPANNDSVKSIALIITILADAIAEGKGGSQLFAYQPDEAIVLPEELKKERKFTRSNFRRNPRYQKYGSNIRTERSGKTTAQATTTTRSANLKVTETPVSGTTQAADNHAISTNDLETKTITELKELLKAKNLPLTGKKTELIERLQGA